MFKFLGKNKVFNSTILHQVKLGETLKDIAKEYNVNYEILKQNPTQELYAGQCVLVSHLGKKYHIVKPLETVSSISKLYNISEEELLQKNNARQIFIGQLLEI